MIFLSIELKKVIVFENCLKFNCYFFFLPPGTPTTNKLDDGVSVTHFSGLQVTGTSSITGTCTNNLMIIYW